MVTVMLPQRVGLEFQKLDKSKKKKSPIKTCNEVLRSQNNILRNSQRETISYSNELSLKTC